MAIRATVIGGPVEVEGGELVHHFDREEFAEYMADAAGTLIQFGGQLSIVAERFKVGEVAGEPVMETRRVLCFYKTSAPLAGDETAAVPVADDSPED